MQHLYCFFSTIDADGTINNCDQTRVLFLRTSALYFRFVAEDYPWGTKGATLIPIVQICNCSNGVCDYDELLPDQGNGSEVFRYVGCTCDAGWIGKY